MATHFITGAGSGIGAEIARLLAARGDELVLLARTEARAVDLATEFTTAQIVVADLAYPHTLGAALATARMPTTFDSVIHAAGVVDLGSVSDLPVTAWQSQLTVNLVAPAELTRLLLPQVRAGAGHVVFVNSGAGLRTHAGWSAYAASKHGLKALADGLREEEAVHGVRVTSVYPGRTATAMQARVHEQEGRMYDASRFIDPLSIATTVLTAIDLPRDAHLTDLTVRPGNF